MRRREMRCRRRRQRTTDLPVPWRRQRAAVLDRPRARAGMTLAVARLRGRMLGLDASRMLRRLGLRLLLVPLGLRLHLPLRVRLHLPLRMRLHLPLRMRLHLAG
jgi:hypothetical protein